MGSQRQAPRILTKPTPGFYLLRLVPNAWQVGAHVIERDGAYTAEVNGKPLATWWTEEELETAAVRCMTTGTLFDHPMLRIVLFGSPCDEATYRHRLEMKAWAESYDENHPAANPTKPMDPRLLPAEDF